MEARTMTAPQPAPRSDEDYSKEAASPTSRDINTVSKAVSPTRPGQGSETNPLIVDGNDACHNAHRTMESLREQRQMYLQRLREVDAALQDFSVRLHSIANG
jgi:hypothetical protein